MVDERDIIERLDAVERFGGTHLVVQHHGLWSDARKEINRLRAENSSLRVHILVLKKSADYHKSQDCIEIQNAICRERDELSAENARLRERKDNAYEERNRVVALLASVFPSGVKKTAIPGWDAEWHGCVYIDLPTGQASWHYHDSQAHLFSHLPPYQGDWDGHTTEIKYERVARAALAEKEPK